MKTVFRMMSLLLAVAWGAVVAAQETDDIADNDIVHHAKHVEQSKNVDSDAFVLTLTTQEIVQIQQNLTQFIERTIQMLFELSPDGVVTDDILDRREKMQIAAARMSLIGRISIYNLDGDFNITKEEIEFQFPVLPI